MLWCLCKLPEYGLNYAKLFLIACNVAILLCDAIFWKVQPCGLHIWNTYLIPKWNWKEILIEVRFTYSKFILFGEHKHVFKWWKNNSCLKAIKTGKWNKNVHRIMLSGSVQRGLENGGNILTLIFENLKPVERSKNLFNGIWTSSKVVLIFKIRKVWLKN